jgi:fucose 4-O-acetylase-like acetyltransferase
MTGAPAEVKGSRAAAQVAGDRLVFVDVLRVGVIVWVIGHHAAQPYGPTGGDWPITGQGNLEWLGPLFPLGAAFGMGLLFLLAGYFVPRSYDRKGANRFLRERFVRIGLPMAIFVLLVHVPVVYLTETPRQSFGEFVGSLYESGWLNAYLHLWFLGHLVLYSVGYVAWRHVVDRRASGPRRAWSPPGHAGIVGFIIALALVSWIVRIWYPIDEWVPLFFFMAAEPAHLPQYVGLFGLGVAAYRGDWLRRLPTSFGVIWLAVGLVASTGYYIVEMLGSDSANADVATGGFTARSALYTTWEALICAAMVVGLVVVGRAVFRRGSPLLGALAAASYAAYILHVTFVVGLQAGLEDVDLSTSIKFAVVAILGVLLAFGAGHVSRRVPGLRTLLGTTPRDPET